ncbi:unnamed protein product [Schistosoma turkestanicum]|nr:unnamed protein product [Schistosoma turkestanicum]
MTQPLQTVKQIDRSNSSLPLTSLTEKQCVDFSTTSQENSTGVINKMTKIHKYFRGAMSAMKSATKNKIFNPDEESSDEDEEVIGNQGIRLRSSRQARGRREFLQIKLVQEMKNEHTGAIWAMRFSPCGRLLATAGYDRNIRIWVLKQCYRYFKEMQRSSTPPPTSAKYESVGSFISNDFQTKVNFVRPFQNIRIIALLAYNLLVYTGRSRISATQFVGLAA